MPRLFFFDEPLSQALCKTLGDIVPGSLHIRLLGQGGAADAIAWELARQHGCLVVRRTKTFTEWLCCGERRRSSCGFDSTTARPTTLRNYCGAIMKTSPDSTSRTKRRSSSSADRREVDVRPEYRFDYSQAKPNRFASRMTRPVVAVVLEPDIAAVFDSSAKVNAQLRSAISARKRRKRARTRGDEAESAGGATKVPQTDRIHCRTGFQKDRNR